MTSDQPSPHHGLWCQQRTVLVVDLGGELLAPLHALTDLLYALVCWEADDAEDPPTERPVLRLAEPLARGRALRAVQRLTAALEPTQSLGPGRGRLLAPDGIYDHAWLSVFTLPAADIDLLSQTAQILGHPGLHPDLAALVEGAVAGLSTHRQEVDRAGFVSLVARTAGLLDLATTPQAQLLIDRLRVVGPEVDLALTEDEEAAYAHTADRMNAMWALGATAARALY